MTATGAFRTLLDRAQRRYWSVLIVEQAVMGMAAALGALVLLLVVGTQILNGYWPAAIFAAAFAWGLWRTWQRRLNSYQIAQRVDQQFASHDLLSTAWYFSQPECSRAVDQEIRRRQFAEAERFAENTDPGAVFPWRVPRALWATVAMAGVVATLFVVRYGMERKLDLKKPLVAVDLGAWFAPKPSEVAEAPKKNPIQKYLDEQLKTMGIPADAAEKMDKATEPQMTRIEAPSEEGEKSAKGERGAKAENLTAKGEKNDEGTDPADGQQQSATPDSREGNSDSNSQNAANAGQKPPPGNQQKQPGESSSMMDKMRDAMANLMAKLKMPQQKTGDDKAGNQQQQSQQSASQQGQSQEGQSPGKKAEGNPQGQQQSQSQGEGSEKADAQGKQGDRSADKPGQQDSKSGVGKSDGDKSVREAEQLAAMGKISELIGKRSQNVAGEITVEVQSGRQQSLKTPYTHRTGAHLETGGESHRDEIPLAYEQYVQQYFEQVHRAGAKQAAAAEAKAKGAAH